MCGLEFPCYVIRHIRLIVDRQAGRDNRNTPKGNHSVPYVSDVGES